MYDYIIVGGGSAGSVAAMRLVRDYGKRVLLLERGRAKTNAVMAMPAGYMKYLASDTFLEMHQTTAQPQLGGRTPIVPVAKVLGGGSSVNAMVYMRGQREDYDDWSSKLRADGAWSYEDLLPHFTGIEQNEVFNDRFHGVRGELPVSFPKHVSDTTYDFLRAAQALGHPLNIDFNGASQNGVGIMQHAYGQWGRFRRRSDAKAAFLDPLEKDKRLTIVTQAQCDRILIENGRAVGVSYRRFGTAHVAHAEHEVLIAAGAYNTAKLLMLSGIGPGAELQRPWNHRGRRLASGTESAGPPRGAGDRVLKKQIRLFRGGSRLADDTERPPISDVQFGSRYHDGDRGVPLLRP